VVLPAERRGGGGRTTGRDVALTCFLRGRDWSRTSADTLTHQKSESTHTTAASTPFLLLPQRHKTQPANPSPLLLSTAAYTPNPGHHHMTRSLEAQGCDACRVHRRFVIYLPHPGFHPFPCTHRRLADPGTASATHLPPKSEIFHMPLSVICIQMHGAPAPAAASLCFALVGCLLAHYISSLLDRRTTPASRSPRSARTAQKSGGAVRAEC
jgi:hypothetical protein